MVCREGRETPGVIMRVLNSSAVPAGRQFKTPGQTAAPSPVDLAAPRGSSPRLLLPLSLKQAAPKQRDLSRRSIQEYRAQHHGYLLSRAGGQPAKTTW